jgi:hypothetical protein
MLGAHLFEVLPIEFHDVAISVGHMVVNSVSMQQNVVGTAYFTSRVYLLVLHI